MSAPLWGLAETEQNSSSTMRFGAASFLFSTMKYLQTQLSSKNSDSPVEKLLSENRAASCSVRYLKFSEPELLMCCKFPGVF